MADLNDFLKVKEDYERLRDELHRLIGARQLLVEELKKLCGTGDVQDALRKMDVMKEEFRVKTSEFGAAQGEFEKKWTTELEDSANH